MTTRRRFLERAAGGVGSVLAGAGLSAQTPPQGRGMIHDSMVVRDTTNLFAMDQNAARAVHRPPKPNAVPVLTNVQRDELEHRLHCQCGCTLDVFTCRTTDFTCQVSPAMHADVMDLVKGGYDAQEIIDAFVDTYGQRALMAPKKSGFDLLAWVTPGISVIIAGSVLAVLLRRWGQRAASHQVATPVTPALDATPEELARLEAAVRGDDDA
jgi:cytochrome c-type biogenesis protein CcmH